jgi:ATP-dependent protease ClpP protease subunit
MIANPRTMSSTINIDGRIDNAMVLDVKKILRKFFGKKNHTINIRIFSHGGNLWAYYRLSGFLYFMKKYAKNTIVGQAEFAESAALLLFLSCPIRQITLDSIGIIHLPEPTDGKEIPSSTTDKRTTEVINFIKRRTGMTEQQIRSLEHQKLTAHQMLELGIATEIVDSFSQAKAA